MEQMASRPFSHVLVELHVPPAAPNCVSDAQQFLRASGESYSYDWSAQASVTWFVSGKTENFSNEADAPTMETSFNVTQLLPASYTPGTRKRRKVRNL